MIYPVIKEIHSYVAFALLLVLIFASVYALIGWLRGKEFTAVSKRILLISLIATHLQFVFGILIYFLSPLGISNFSGETMKNSIGRLYVMEHPLMMLIGIMLITVGYSRSKRAINSHTKFKSAGIFYTIGLVLILSRIPWHAWFG